MAIRHNKRFPNLQSLRVLRNFADYGWHQVPPVLQIENGELIVKVVIKLSLHLHQGKRLSCVILLC